MPITAASDPCSFDFQFETLTKNLNYMNTACELLVTWENHVQSNSFMTPRKGLNALCH